jgi:hypothetical protein
MNKTKNICKLLGAFLVLGSVVGFFTVADEFHHGGELIGMLCVLFAGLMLLLAASGWAISRRLALPWLAACVLLGIPVGGILLDNMPVGAGLGLTVGLAAAILLAKKRSG